MSNIYLKQATKGIKSNPSRTFLTTLGIMIGIGTVVLVLTAGEGFKSYINSQVEAFGSNTLIIQTSVPSSTKSRAKSSSDSNDPNTSAVNAVPITTLKTKDVNDIKNIPNVKNAYGASVGQQIVTRKNISKTTFILGSTAERFDIDKGVIEIGRGFTTQENKALAQVAVLGDKIAEDLFPNNNNPIGELIRIGNYNFKVIGVYARTGGLDPSNDGTQIVIPNSTLQKKIQGIDYLVYIVAELKDNNKAEATALDVADVLRINHYIKNPNQDDFKVQTQAESLNTFNVILKAITFLLIAIASISLIVGGVGVMNIMYVVVTERVGEIGLKKALGAKRRDILYEFMIEAILLTFIGGAIGIIGGLLLGYIISKIAQNMGLAWDFVVPVWGLLISVSISTAIGIIFGVFPARNASNLDPIEALNKE